MNVANHVPPAKGSFRCRICKKLGKKTTANQKVHAGECDRKRRLAYGRTRQQRNARSGKRGKTLV